MAKQLGDQLVKIAVKQLEQGVKFKQPRMRDIQKSEDLYAGKTKPPLKGRINVPLPIMSGFVNTLKAKLDDPVSLLYTHTELADLRKAKKVSAAWQLESGPTRQAWDRKDRAVKGLAIFSGVGAEKYTASSVDGKYTGRLEPVDYVDLVTEPLGGMDLEDHLYAAQMNIFRSKWDIEQNAQAKFYDPNQAVKLIAAQGKEEFKRNTELFKNKINRFSAIGLDPMMANYAGGETFNLVEQTLVWKGKRYYLLYDYETGIWIRCQEQREVFGYDRYQWVTWHTHEDPYNFWSKAPCDDMRPVADAMNIIFNQALENRQRRNYGQRGYDPDIFPDPAQLEWAPDGLVLATPPPGRSIQSGIYNFTTEEVTGTIELFNFMDNFLGRETGVTPGSQGAAPANKPVGVYYGDMKQLEDRLSLYNKSYSEAQAELGVRYWVGLRENLTEGFLVKMIGMGGSGWEEITADDTDPIADFDITATSGTMVAAANSTKRAEQAAALKDIATNKDLMATISTRWLAEQRLKSGGFDDEALARAFDKKYEGNEELLSYAAQVVEDIKSGKTPKKFRGATDDFLQYILDQAFEIEDLTDEQFNTMTKYVEQHIPIAQENLVRRAINIQAARGLTPDKLAPLPPGDQLPGAAPVPDMGPASPEAVPADNAGGTQARSQMISNNLQP